ncbi:MAG TPA: hypothetical protein VFF13_04550 [archaeon]|nr:hypothetical protein [archaeon]
MPKKRGDPHRTVNKGVHPRNAQLEFRNGSVQSIEGLMKFYLRSEQKADSGRENRRTAIGADILKSLTGFESRFDTNPQHQFIIKEIKIALENNDTVKLQDLLERHTCNLKIQPEE